MARPALIETRWLLHGALVAVGALVWAFAYRDAIARAVAIWWDSPTYSHCFLVLPVSLFLIWRRREAFARLRPDFYPPALLLALPAGLLWLLGEAASVNEAMQLAALSMFEILLLAMLGPQIFRTFLFPFLFLFFLVPVGQYLVGPLQSYTTWFVSAGLTALGILHYTEGNVIQLANGTFEVAEACAGLRFLVANIVLCLLFAYTAFRKPHKIAIFLIAAIVIPIIANSFRALGIVLIAHWSDNRLAVGADHLVYGWGFSVAILLVFFLLAARYRDPPRPVPVIPRAKPVRSPLTAFVPAAALLLIAAPPALASVRDAASLRALPDLASPPRPGWSRSAAASPWSPDLPPPDQRQRFDLRPQGGEEAVDVLVDYYRGTDKDHSLIVAPNRLWDERAYNLLASSAAAPSIGGRPQPFREFLLQSPGETRLVWWSYWKDGRFTDSGSALKWMALKDLFGRQGGAALVALSVRISGTEEEARSRLAAAAWALDPLDFGKGGI